MKKAEAGPRRSPYFELCRLKHLGLALSLAALSACSSTLSVSSDPPGADVYLSQSPTQKTGTAIGQTPVEVNMSDLPLDRGGYLIFERPGFLRETILISEAALGTTQTDIFVRLTQGSRDGEKASTLLGLLAAAQEQVQQGKLDLAHTTVDRALELDPFFARGITFKGALFFMEKKYALSEEFYKKALGLDPNLIEATRMLARIDTARKEATP